MRRVYLATCYSARDEVNAHLRFHKEESRCYLVTKAAARLMSNSADYLGRPTINIFSPITHSRPFVEHIPERLDTHTFWLKLDFDWIDMCDELWVFMQPGWEDSYGVQEEIRYAKKKGMPVRYVDMDLQVHDNIP